MSFDTSSASDQDKVIEFKGEIKKMMLERLAATDWVEKCRNRCRAYIDQNGTKFISLAEVRDFVSPDAQKSFPESIRMEMNAIVNERLESLLASMGDQSEHGS